MAGRPSFRAQLSAQRFLLRRLEYAVLGRPMPRRHDPLRAQKFSLLAGCAVATGVLVLDAVLGASRHYEGPGDAALVMSRQSGALFVRVDDRLRPVANLTSARLILGSPAEPRLVDETALGDVADGPLLGIPGAPRTLGKVAAPRDLRWAVCDGAGGQTTVVVGGDWVAGELDPRAAVVVTVAHGDGSVYLLYDGKRAMIDPGDPATARALHLDGVAARKVSPTVLNAIPEVPAISQPRIAGMGQPSGITGLPVGTVVRVIRTDSSEYYVVLPGGLQRVGRLTVDLIRFADSAAPAEILEVPPELIARNPLVDVLPVATYPDEPPSILDVDEDLCATWHSGRSGLAVSPGAADGSGAVTLAGSDGDGPGVDIVRVPPGRSLDVTGTGATARYLITDAGVRFPVSDSAVAALGLAGTPAVAPWAIIGALPAGPELERDAALVGRDVLVSAP
jgi:type VII secretion protein EccB